MVGRILLPSIVVFLSACGIDTPTVQSPSSPNQITAQAETPASTPPALPPTEIVLIEPTLLESKTILLSPENYWVAWYNPEVGYVAASRSGVPITLPTGSTELESGVALAEVIS